ncbi:heme exporter protein CcmB [Rhodomicrobium vannielii ATCC 17100]|uniref:Heme exporter protein B n=1 Tax=Rhodomicrobium udaipurense TaxID=1202716 RepID=A0A8I1KL20_9HYPH|nr:MULTISPECIES: heme exporter protein CcmB [Rhodomicrobium]KAI95259.1 heme transporter [Rhodomicrobium udaipurense JA643]MBJ7534775.1 heme exporter protein CcmB [Rhodomicrobium vannielii ATCC 17100]MBJ7542668.1 heme exporter protein CcmB [Rhodomicrobium udaipurense]
MNAFLALLTRDLTLALRQGSAIGTALGFYLIAVSIIPLGLGPDLALLSRIAPGILWISFLLSAVLSVDALFQEDRDDGSLDALAIGPLPAELIATSKSLAHWLTTCVPLIVVTPLAGLLLNMELDAVPKLLATLAVGTLGISFVAGAGAALTLGLRRGALLLPLLILPLFAPFLIFGVGALSGAAGAFSQSILLLGALSLFSVAAMPFAAALALRLSLE